MAEAGEQGWRSANELDDFAARPGSPVECDWRSLDPRLADGEEDDEDGLDEAEEENPR